MRVSTSGYDGRDVEEISGLFAFTVIQYRKIQLELDTLMRVRSVT